MPQTLKREKINIVKKNIVIDVISSDWVQNYKHHMNVLYPALTACHYPIVTLKKKKLKICSCYMQEHELNSMKWPRLKQ